MKHLHIHTDCEYFAGCERLLPIIWNSDEIREVFRITFSYRRSKRYEMELGQFLNRSIIVKPVFTNFHLSTIRIKSDASSRRRFYRFLLLLDQLLAIIFIYPLFIYEFIKLTFVFLKGRPNVLHINNGGYPGARSTRAAACAGKICGVPKIIMVVNNIAVPITRLTRLLEAPIDFLVRRSVHTFITASNHANEAISNTLKLKQDQSGVIPNAVAQTTITESRLSIRESMQCDPSIIVIGIVAVLEKRKGHQVFLDALSIIKRDNPQLVNRLRIWFIGDGPLAFSLKAETKKLGIEDAIHFLGYRYDYRKLISATDILVLSSVSDEDSPLSTIEAMSFGVPLIVSDFAGLSDQVVNNVNGLLFPVGNSIELAIALTKLINEQELRTSMGTASLARYHACYSITQFISNYLSLYLGNDQQFIGQSTD